jgi:hypothetical protein
VSNLLETLPAQIVYKSSFKKPLGLEYKKQAQTLLWLVGIERPTHMIGALFGVIFQSQIFWGKSFSILKRIWHLRHPFGWLWRVLFWVKWFCICISMSFDKEVQNGFQMIFQTVCCGIKTVISNSLFSLSSSLFFL